MKPIILSRLYSISCLAMSESGSSSIGSDVDGTNVFARGCWKLAGGAVPTRGRTLQACTGEKRVFLMKYRQWLGHGRVHRRAWAYSVEIMAVV
jgi:hypothetical protein